MLRPGPEIQIEYDEEDRSCHAILKAGEAIGLGTTARDALEDLGEAAYFYIDTMINLKLQEMREIPPVEGGEENGNV